LCPWRVTCIAARACDPLQPRMVILLQRGRCHDLICSATLPSDGFSLIELLVVIAIIAVLVGLLLRGTGARESGARPVCEQHEADRSGDADYETSNKSYPAARSTTIRPSTAPSPTSAKGPFRAKLLGVCHDARTDGSVERLQRDQLQTGDGQRRQRLWGGINAGAINYTGLSPGSAPTSAPATRPEPEGRPGSPCRRRRMPVWGDMEHRRLPGGPSCADQDIATARSTIIRLRPAEMRDD